MRSRLSAMLAGFGPTSPRSAQRAASKGRIPLTGCSARIMVEASRSWRGPWRGPGRFDVPPSHGAPTRPISTSAKRACSEGTWGKRMKVGTPAKRGRSNPDTGVKKGSDMERRLAGAVFKRKRTEIFLRFRLTPPVRHPSRGNQARFHAGGLAGIYALGCGALPPLAGAAVFRSDMPARESDFEPFFKLHFEQAATTFSQLVTPPRARGTTWSKVNSPFAPQYWQQNSSRKNRLNRVKATRFCGCT